MTMIKAEREERYSVGCFVLVPLGRLSAKRETNNHPLCGWATKGYTNNG